MGRSSPEQWKLILVPFSWLYGLGVWIRNSLYDTGLIPSKGFNIPTLVVGNITVGGTGKTPHIEYLADLLKENFRVAVLSRGYRRKTKDFMMATASSATREIGDEPCQVKSRFPDVTVAVDRDRVHGIRELMKQNPPIEVVLLDDAFQHRALRPGFAILLIDFNRPMVRDRLLPAGRLREPAINRKRANMILVTRSPEAIKPIEMREFVNRLGLELGQYLFFTTMEFGELIPVFGKDRTDNAQTSGDAQVSGAAQASGAAQPGAVLVVSGVADPSTLVDYAASLSEHVSVLSFRDHHNYSAGDVERIHALAGELQKKHGYIMVLTTEKDAVKLRELDMPGDLRKIMVAVRIKVKFLNADGPNFEKKIINYVTSNKRSSILYQGQNKRSS
jgi:tetraacyldisaccharide 4'-kinase